MAARRMMLPDYGTVSMKGTHAVLSNPCNRSAGTAGSLICKNERGTVPEGTGSDSAD